MAFFQLGKVNILWTFSAVDKQGTGFQKRTLPLIAAQQQTVDVLASGTSANPDDLAHVLILSPSPSAPVLSNLPDLSISLADATAALRNAYLVDNPSSSFNPRTLDCGTCHVATRNRSYAERKRSIDTTGWSERFQDSRYNLSRTDAVSDDPRSLRSFGYFGTKSSIAGRTIHESAVVAAAIVSGMISERRKRPWAHGVLRDVRTRVTRARPGRPRVRDKYTRSVSPDRLPCARFQGVDNGGDEMRSRKIGWLALCGLALMAACGEANEAFETKADVILRPTSTGGRNEVVMLYGVRRRGHGSSARARTTRRGWW